VKAKWLAAVLAAGGGWLAAGVVVSASRLNRLGGGAVGGCTQWRWRRLCGDCRSLRA